jgi:hypothetical protein
VTLAAEASTHEATGISFATGTSHPRRRQPQPGPEVGSSGRSRSSGIAKIIRLRVWSPTTRAVRTRFDADTGGLKRVGGRVRAGGAGAQWSAHVAV